MIKKDIRLPLGCVVMAAGNASRFGGNKLLALLDGKSLIEHTMDIIPEEETDAVCVVTQYDGIASLARKNGFMAVRNSRPEDGVSRTIRLGTEALMGQCRAILFLVSDQPRLRRESVCALIRQWRSDPESITAAACGGHFGNPCIFPEEYFPELLALTGDTGGKAVIRRHADRLRLFEVEADELTDIDTPEALRRQSGEPFP